MSSLISKDRGESRILKRITEVGETSICTSVVVAAAIPYGVAKKGSTRLSESADRVLSRLVTLPVETPSDRTYASIRWDLERRGLMIGPNDLLIAAQCLSLNLILVTNNTREFEHVAGLTVEDWLA